MQKQKKLGRIATILKATFLAYRECMFDLDIESIEYREGSLCLQLGSKLDLPIFVSKRSHSEI
jgi:hypothetical protein